VLASDRVARARSDLGKRLAARRDEIEKAILTRLFAIAEPTDTDPAYLDGLRGSVSVSIDYALEAIERGGENMPEPPPPLRAQARMAAREGISLDIVLRRYLAGYTLLTDYLAAESERARALTGAELTSVLHGPSVMFDRVIEVVSEEHRRESEARMRTPNERRLRRVERLLAGEPVDPSPLGYDFDGHHVGLAVIADRPNDAIQALAANFDCRLLLVRPMERTAWAWLGGRCRIDPTEIHRVATAVGGVNGFAIGEPAEGLDGWRLTHRQAVAAVLVAEQGDESVVRYADVPLIAAVAESDLLGSSLRQLFIEPLERDRDGGSKAFETLNAYFAAERNAASAGAALGVSRQAVNARLRLIEERLGLTVSSCAAELEVALSLCKVDR